MRQQGNRGQQNGNAVLKEGEVRIIRQLLEEGASVTELCQLYCVSAETISRIKNRRTWAWLDVVDYKEEAAIKREPTATERMGAAASLARLQKKLVEDGLVELAGLKPGEMPTAEPEKKPDNISQEAWEKAKAYR